MPFVTYMLFSILDAAVINMFILKLYRLPLMQYRFKLLGLSIVLAVSSFIMRIYMDLPAWDVPLQYIIYVLFYCYALKYRLHYAAFIVGSGLSAYITFQILISYVMTSMGMLDKSDIISNTGPSVNILQLCTAIVGESIAIFLKTTGRGFSFIPVPPHDTYKIKYTEYNNLIVVVSGFISAVTISLMFLILLYQNYMLIVLLSMGTFAIAYYFSHRGDYESVRGAIEKYRTKIENK